MASRYKEKRGVTLTELMVAVAILSVGILGFFSAFRYITKSLFTSRSRTLATNLGQEKIESLKNLSYYELLITTAPAVNNSVSPPVTYDTTNYPPETISIGGITFTRYTFVALAQMDNNVISTVTYTFPDTGMKKITVTTVWNDGGVNRQWTLTNLLENPDISPLDATLAGTVRDTASGTPVIQRAYVFVENNPDWNAFTDANGNFSFRVYHGSYTIRVSSDGYYPSVSGTLDAQTGQTVDVGTIYLQKIATGTVVGTAWLNPQILISQVVVSSVQHNAPAAQYIELFNPTTAQIPIADCSPPPCTDATPVVRLNLQPRNAAGNTECQNVPLVYVSTYVPSRRYFLISNRQTMTIGGASKTADAYFNTPLDAGLCTGMESTERILNVDRGGAARIVDSAGANFDAIGWSGPAGGPPASNLYEGSYVNLSGNGMGENRQLVRVSSPMASIALGGPLDLYGRAYDSNDNADDFLYDGAAQLGTAMGTSGYSLFVVSSGSFPVVAGVPAVGAVVASSDPYSGSTVAWAAQLSSGSLSLTYARYGLVGVTTGTWMVTIASTSAFNQYTPVTIVQNVSTGVPNGSTSPSWTASGASNAILSSGTVAAFVKGRVTDISNNPVSGISVIAGGGQKNTGANGTYFVTSATGPITITCNPNNANPSYVQLLYQATVTEGQVHEQDCILLKGGTIMGYLTTGTTPLPNYVVQANIGGHQYGSATSDSSGYFYIRNLATGTYTVAPVLEIAQDSEPNSVDTTVTSGATVFSASFTISGAFGYISGTVRNEGELVTSGALILASTGTISSTPPAVVASSAPAQVPTLYSVSSKADGTYNIAVRGGNTYRLSAYIPVISGSSVSTTTKTYSGIVVSPSATTTQNITIP